MGGFPIFLKKVVDIIAPKPSIIIFRRLISFRSVGSLLMQLLPKGASSPNKENYQPISITLILSMEYEKLNSHKLSSFCEKYRLLLAAQFAYWKGLECTDALLTISLHLQKSIDAETESYIVQLALSLVFNRVSHRGLLFNRWRCAVHFYRVPLRL